MDGRYNFQSSFSNGSDPFYQKDSNHINAVVPHSHGDTAASLIPTPLSKSHTSRALRVTHPSKPRGRPRGSKNKQIQTEVKRPGLEPIYLRIQPGSDVISIVRKYACENGLGVTILSGSGFVSNISFHGVVPHSTPIKRYPGPFSMLSLTGTFVPFPSSSPPSSSSSPPSSLVPSCYFGICLAGTHGNIFGGIINGSVTAATEVVLMVATFKEAPTYKLPEANSGQRVVDNFAARGCNGANTDNHSPPEVASSSRPVRPTPLPLANNPMTWDQLSFHRRPLQ